MKEPCAWHGTIGDFLASASVLESLITHHSRCMCDEASPSQIQAWKNCINALQSELTILVGVRNQAKQWSLIFEYELPRERGRRPDVVVIANTAIFVLEFKDFLNPLNSHLDQVSAYAHDLQHYHAASHGQPIRHPKLDHQQETPLETFAATRSGPRRDTSLPSPRPLVHNNGASCCPFQDTAIRHFWSS